MNHPPSFAMKPKYYPRPSAETPTARASMGTGLGLLLLSSFTCFGVEITQGQPAILERGLDHRVIQTIREEQAFGRTNRVVERYNEVASGMHYVNSQGELVEARETIDIVNGFGIATQAQHRAIFSPSITDSPVTDWVAPDGKRIQSRIMGIVYFNRADATSQLVAETKQSIGQVSQNSVIYPDAFDDVVCDVRYTFKRNSFEQDLIITKQLPAPEDPENTLVQIWTELLDCPVPVKRTTILRRETDPVKRQVMASPDITDDRLIFGQSRIGRGKAFAIENDAIAQAGINLEKAVPVGKEFAVIEGKTWLIESAEYKALKPFLDTLPRMAALPSRTNQTGRLAAASSVPGAILSSGAATPERSPPPDYSEAIPPSSVAAPEDRRAPVARSRERLVSSFRKPVQGRAGESKIQVAQVSKTPRYEKAVNIDYAIRIGSTNSYTFKADETTYISGNFSPTSVILEGGSVLKFAPTNNACVSSADFTFSSTNYRPVVVTARDDNTVGSTITNSTGSPGGNVYANPAFLDLNDSTLQKFQYLRVSYANTAIEFETDSGMASVRHCQFAHCADALLTYGVCSLTCENSLFYDIGTAAFDAPNGDDYFDVFSSHLTVDVCDTLGRGHGTLRLTNSILSSVAELGDITLQSGSVASAGSGSGGYFEIVGAAAHYLTNGSPYRNAGTTNISPSLLAELANLTTYPPIVLPTNTTVGNTNWVLSPQAQRNSGIPDLGYHYPPLDFVFGFAFMTNSTILLTNGVSIGTFAPTIANVYGIVLDRDATLISEGSPTNLNRIVRYNTVQEQANNWGTNRSLSSIETTYQSHAPGTIRFRFTDWSVLAQDNEHVQAYGSGVDFPLEFKDCQFHGGSFTTGRPVLNVTNCLFERVGLNLNGDYPTDATFRNCTFYAGSLTMYQEDEAGTWTFLDNIFDRTSISAALIALTNDYNGYLTNSDRLPLHGTNDVVLATNQIGWQSSWLGSFYLPTNSAFLDKGSLTNAALIGLYHYTMLTNQTKELTNHLDIGFHCVAVTNGVPIDGDGDGLADYLEDGNGNGVLDAGESDFTLLDSDGDGVNDYLEFLQGRNRRVVGSIADTNNLINLRVYTPLK